MSKFVRIDKESASKKEVLLNLDLVATIELSQQSDLLGSNGDGKRFYANFLSFDKTIIATLHFDKVEEAHAWVAQHLGVQP